MPFVMQWPDVITANTVYNKPVISFDIFATAVANAKVTPKNKLDGVDLIPYLNGEKKGLPHQVLYWRKFDQNAYAARRGDYKVVKYKTKTDKLYNIEEDIGETASLGKTNNEKYSEIKKAYDVWDAEMKDPEFMGLLQDEAYSQIHPNRFGRSDSSAPDTLKPKAPTGYKLLWNDEFDRTGKPDPNKWMYEKGFVRNEELQWYQADNANISKGVLEIEGRRERVENPNFDKKSDNWRKNRPVAEYTSACIKTKEKFNFQYGIMEVRAKIDTSMGIWPAIWTLGVSRRWPSNGEVDQLEYYRHKGKAKILANAAWSDPKGKIVWDSEKIPISEFMKDDPDWEKRFHIWKMDWTEKRIRLYLDDRLLNEIPIEEAKYLDGFNPFHQAQYILLNLAIGSNGGDPSETTFPRKYLVDYVRVYQKDKK